MNFLGGNEQYGQVTCEVTGVDVTIDAVTMTWVKQTGEAADIVTVTTETPGNVGFVEKMTASGTLTANSANISVSQVDGVACEASYFLCEVTFTKQSGERATAMAVTAPGRRQSDLSYQDMSNDTMSALDDARQKLIELKTSLEALNQTHAALLESKQTADNVNANISARISHLEDMLSSRDQSCDSCLNVTNSLEDLQSRLAVLENSAEVTVRIIKLVN